MSCWQSINSAPRDGSVVLVWDDVGAVPCFSSSFIDSDWPKDLRVHVLPARLVRASSHDEWFWETIVVEYDFGYPSDRSFDATSITIKPSHWMPMPVSPH